MLVAEGTNPDTCRHHLVQVIVTMQLNLFLVCVSCASTIDNEFKDEFEWGYDIDHDVWKRYPKRLRPSHRPSIHLDFRDYLSETLDIPREFLDSSVETISPEYWLEHTYDYSNGLGFWIERPDDIRSS